MLDHYFETLRLKEPDLKIAYKDQSLFMKILAAILFFNPAFSKQFITVIGKTIYYPSKDNFDALDPVDVKIHISHEYRHMRDSSKNPLFYFLYLCPQILAPLWLFLGFVSWPAAIALFILFLLPLPAPFRAYYEYRGYETGLFVINQMLLARGMDLETRKAVLEDNLALIKPQFTTFNYYVMWIFGIEKQMTKSIDKILSDQIFKEDDVFEDLRQALK